MQNKQKKQESIDIIKAALLELTAQGKKATQENVASLTKGKVSIATIKRHWKIVSPKKEIISPEPKNISPKSDPIIPHDSWERFKRFNRMPYTQSPKLPANRF